MVGMDDFESGQAILGELLQPEPFTREIAEFVPAGMCDYGQSAGSAHAPDSLDGRRIVNLDVAGRALSQIPCKCILNGTGEALLNHYAREMDTSRDGAAQSFRFFQCYRNSDFGKAIRETAITLLAICAHLLEPIFKGRVRRIEKISEKMNCPVLASSTHLDTAHQVEIQLICPFPGPFIA